MQSRPTHSFLFADLVGFTALTYAQGDDAAADLALALADAVALIAAEHGAQLVKSIGDAVMVHAPDAAEAVRLGLRIVGELDHRRGFPPIRVGIHTGPAVERAGDWFGATINLAARVSGAARGGEVLMTETTLAASGDCEELGIRELGMQTFKGVVSPLPVYAACGSPAPAREPASRRQQVRPRAVPAPALAAASA